MSRPNRPIRMIVACGAGIAQSSMLKMQLKEAFEDKKIPLDINHCTLNEIQGKVQSFNPDFIVTTSPCPYIVPDHCHPIVGLAIFTGFGKEEVLEDIFNLVENDVTKE